ncbi:MAG: dihydroorotase [Saprospiraceae bacterium]
MEIFIEQARLLYPGHALHDTILNIGIRNGNIVGIDASKKYNGKKISGKNIHVSPGWVDIGTQCGEPGYEHRETLQSLSVAASKGGYTTLAVFPNTKPVLNSKSEIEFIFQKSRGLQTEIIPIGSVSKLAKGTELAEMIDMHHSGAIAFSDGKYPVQDTGILHRALLYRNHFDGLLINQPLDDALSALGQMHEGVVSQRLGLKGIPVEAEVIMLLRDIHLANYSGGRFLCHLISSVSAIQEIKSAKRTNKKLFASVAYLNLVLNDKVLEDFDSAYKQNPVIRSEADQKALNKAVKDQVIDIIVSNHTPLEIEKKDLEFAYADAGTIGLQTSFSAVNTQGTINPEEWVKAVAINPRKILNIDEVNLVPGQIANLTIFDPSVEWVFTNKHISSKSKNTPFNGTSFKGKVLATFSKGQTYIAGTD